ncbi:MAG: HEAT repeat domain-containing protein, partial [Victivallaceae bacterium]
FFLEMCDEWPPEAVDFLKKQYANPDPKYSSSIRDIIVAASIKNHEMINWLKPYMAEFAAARTEIRKGTRINPDGNYEEFSEPCGKMSSKVGAAYMLIAGESDPVKIARTYVFYRDGFIYEYAYATGKYNDACRLIEKISSGFSWRPQERSWRAPHTMLYDKSDLNAKNRIMLLKMFLLGSCIVKIPDTVYSSSDKKVQFVKIQDTSAEDEQMMKIFLRECRLLHQDNLPALMELTKDARYAPAAWLAVKAFPVKKMPPEVVEQYFTHCKQELKSSDPKIRNEAIRCLRFFTPDEQRPEAVKLLFAMLLSSDPAVVSAANDSLAAMGPACMPELLETIGGNNPYFAVCACGFIGAMGLYGQEATPELTKLLNSSSDWMLKTMIIKALTLIKGTEAIPEIEKYASDKQTTLAQTATQALVLLKPIPKEILNDPSEFVKNYSRPTAR